METTIWQLRFDVAWIHLLRWAVDPMGRRNLNPELHLYLADRYARMAQHYERVGNRKKRTRFGKFRNSGDTILNLNSTLGALEFTWININQ